MFFGQLRPGAGVYVHGINWSSELASFNAGRLPQVGAPQQMDNYEDYFFEVLT